MNWQRPAIGGESDTPGFRAGLTGATIADLTSPQVTGNGTSPAQLTALSTATTLVTFGIGGNDVHWSTVLTRCAELDMIPAGATYVDTYTPSVARNACAAPAQRWTEPLLPASSAAPLHPSALGEQGMAEAVLCAVTAAS